MAARRALNSQERHYQIKLEFTENDGIILHDSRIYNNNFLTKQSIKNSS